MTKDRNARAETLILEEELVHSSEDRIFDWYKKRSESVRNIENITDQVVETRLLEKDNNLVDLAIALYGVDCDILKIVFKKALDNKNEALVLACLSNNSINRYSSSELPFALFETEEELLKWFKGITKKQIVALFVNYGISDRFLRGYLEGDDYWKVIDEERRVYSLEALCGNTRLQKKYEGWMDGQAEYDFNSVYTACWNLAKNLPVTKGYANVLGILLSKIVDERYEFDSLEVAKRWIIKDENKNKTTKEYLNGYESVRFAIYSDVLKNSESNSESFSNKDIAYRACAYSKLLITEDEIRSAYKKDKVLAIQYISANLNVWRYEKYREVLDEICWDADTKDNNHNLYCTNTYNQREEDLKEKHPDWFVEKDFEDEDEDYFKDEDDKQVTVGKLKSHLLEISDSSFKHWSSIIIAVNSLSDDVSRIRWWIIGCFLLLLILVIR